MASSSRRSNKGAPAPGLMSVACLPDEPMLVVFGFVFGASGTIDRLLGIPSSPSVCDGASASSPSPSPSTQPGTAATAATPSKPHPIVTGRSVDYFELALDIFHASTSLSPPTRECCELYADSGSDSGYGSSSDPSGSTDARAEVSLRILGVALNELRVRPAVVCCLVCKRWKTLVYTIFNGAPGRELCILSKEPLYKDPLITPKRQPPSFFTRLQSIIVPTFGSSPPTPTPLSSIPQPCYDTLHLSAQGTYHASYIYNMYAGNDGTIVTNSKDGRLALWKWSSRKHKLSLLLGIPLRSSYMMSSVLSPCLKYAGCGGLDNTVSLYDWKTASSTPCKEFHGHNGYVSAVRFMNTTERLLSSSGDLSCILWDVETGTAITKFTGANGDVMTVAVSPSNPNEFVSGACDTRTRIYDIRDPDPVITWSDADCDINSVCVSGNGTLYASAGDESICRVYDRRSTRAAAAFKHESVLCGTTSVAFSASGHSLFSTCDSGELIGWSVLTGRLAWRDTSATNRLTCVSLSPPSGDTLFTSSWDNLVRVYTSNP
ncbi:guanine nucleotide-binding protein beta subunit [Pelomyxa schiedti]|nr:guanine nucleotide-binding protein beta subunit [Pelomyxa schiedti]